MLCWAEYGTLKGLYLLDPLDEDNDTLGKVPRALRMHEQRLKTLERTVLAERAEALSRLDGLNTWTERDIEMEKIEKSA